MKKIRTILVDDEVEALQGLRAFLTAYCPQVEICAEAISLQEASEHCRKLSPDVIFLDIEIPGGNGFELLQGFGEMARPEIIFTTAHAQYAVQALREGASDYLLKPIDIDDLCNAVKRVEERLHGKQALFPVLEAKLRIMTANGVEFIPQRHVLLIEADGRYCKVRLQGGRTLIAAKNIGEFEEELQYKGFFRVHKSWLVNCEHVTRVVEGAITLAVLSDDTSVEVSRRRRAEFLKVVIR